MGKKKSGVLIPVPPAKAELPTSYMGFFAQIKERIHQERLRTALAANSAMIKLYWEIGRAILDKTGAGRLGFQSYRQTFNRSEKSLS